MKINSGAVLSSLPDDAHVLAVDSGGGLRRLTPSGLRNDVKDSMGLSKTTNINVTKGQWVRIAQGPYTQSPFVGLVGVSHYYEAGLPQNALLAVSGTGWTEAAFKATPLVAWADPSFDAVRLVKEDGDTLYVEVRFSKKKTQYIYTTIAANNRLTLTDATVSTATADKVVKTIDLRSGGGVMRCITAGYDSLCAPRQKGGHHERGYEDESDWLGLLFGKPLFVSDIHRGRSFKSPLLSVCKAKQRNKRDNRPRRVCDAGSVSILLFSGESAVQHGGKSDVSMEPQRGICLSVDNCHDVGERVGILLQVKKSPRMETMEVNPRHHRGFILNCRKEVAYV